MREDEEGGGHASNGVSLFVSLGLPLGLSVVFHLHGAHVVRATVLCHFDILQLRALRFVAVRRNAMLGSCGGDKLRKTQVSEYKHGRAFHRQSPTKLVLDTTV